MTGLHKFKSKKLCFAFIAIAFSIAITWHSEARSVNRPEIYRSLTSDTIPASKKDTVPGQQILDSTRRKESSETKVDTFSIKISKDTLDAPINYEAQDSAVLFVKDQKFLLYGKTKATHKDVTLTAPEVELNQQTNIITAFSGRDSAGDVVERAQFQQGGQSFQSDTIQFDLKTQKGLTKNTYTKQSEMFIQANVLKKVNENTIFARRGIMTTCDYDQPHFGFVGNKMKLINNKIAVTGPIHPEFEGVPIPIYLPFGIFPLQHGRHSGLLPPQFAVNQQYGLGLEGLGYYHVLNEYFDVTLRGNIYSYGGWSANITPTYRKRYRYNGLLNLSIQHTKINFKGDPDYSAANTFNITWSHSVDPKARPGTNFSANVNAGSTSYNQFVTNNPMRNVTNNQTSSISYSKTWAGTPFNLTLSANESQNSNDHLINIRLPDAGFTMSTIYPFQDPNAAGTPKWWQKIGIGYNGVATNQLSFYDDSTHGKVTASRLLDTLRWGAQHRFPISMTLPPVGPFIISPGVSYEQTWLTHRNRHIWNSAANGGVGKIDTLPGQTGLFVDQHAAFSMNVSTSIYGTFQFKHSKIVALRHVIRPTFSVTYTPNMSSQYYDLIQTSPGATNAKNWLPVSQFDYTNNLFPGYSYGRFGGITFGLDNSLEMKYRSKKDTGDAAIKKVRLIDGFGFTGSYNFLADSLKLEPINISFRSTIGKVNITASTQLDPYQTDSLGQRINRFVWTGSRFRPGRLTSTTVAISTQFQSKPRDQNKEPVKNQNQQQITDPALLSDRQLLVDYMHRNPAEFVDFNMPWQVNLSYSLSVYNQLQPNGRGYLSYKSQIMSSLNFTGSFSLTPKWNFTANGFYDFKTNQLTMFTMTVSRDMHCWQMSLNVTPIGPVRFYSIMINPKASILQDLKVNRQRTYYNY